MNLFKPAGTVYAVESRARDQAAWLIRDYGVDAESVLKAKMRRPGVSDADLYRYDLTAREMRRMRREANAGVQRASLWQPGVYTPAKLLALFRVRALDRRKAQRD
jgi:hypothetical protein